MKKTIFIFCLLSLLAVNVTAQTRIIENPAYEIKSTGIYNVAKIELTDTATFFTMHVTFIPHWWITYDSTEVIRDCATGTEYKIKELRGGVFNQYIWMPDSGDSTVVLVFPPLPASVKKIDYNKHIFGISLDPKLAAPHKPAVVSPAIDKWMNEQLAKAPQKGLANYKSPDFFNDKPARLIGCIKGYDTRLGFTTGIIYASNELIRDDFPVVIKIEPDGRFEAEFPMNMPQYTWAIFNKHYTIPFYIEPGQTLCMILDWDEFLTADRKRNIRYQFNQIEYKGALASLNNELLAYPQKQFSYEEYDKKRKTMTPSDFKADQLREYENDQAQYNEYLKQHDLSEKAKTLLYNKIMLGYANNLLNYTMSRDYYAKQDSTNEILKMPIPNEYYDFLKQLPLNDPSLLVNNEFGEFINRFEYNELFTNAQRKYYVDFYKNRKKPEKNILEYFDEEKIPISDEVRMYMTIITKEQLTDEDKKQLEQMSEVAKNFNEKYKEQLQKYADKYVIPLNQEDECKRNLEIWKLKDSVMFNELRVEPNLVYDIAKVRSLKFTFNDVFKTREKATEFWNSFKQGIKTPYLVTVGQNLLDRTFPETQIASKPLPQCAGTDIFRKIIDPFKGKVLFVDFWATTCGPCVGGIRNMKATREKYAGNPDFDFIFITDMNASPEKNYNSFVEEQGLKNVYRIPTDDYNYLRQLFKFSGIPHYVLIDQKGNVVNDNFNMYNFEMELGKILPAYKKNVE